MGRDERLLARVKDCESQLRRVNEKLNVIMPDLMWATIILAKMTNSDPPSSGA